MEECEILDSEGTELQELMSQDDDDEVEELQNSLREVVQDQSVKPKFQCLMVDASFSMVTVQSEDSGIVWETASSRCSTPWASETSSTSEAYSMEGSGAAGKITIVFDEEKIVRKRTRSGRSSRLGDRLSRPGSSRSASALGVERPEMAEISLPNVKLDKTETEPDLEEIRNKDQQLFSLISEGYEILNIRVPSKLPTVDEEESTELQDNLSYLDQTPKIRSGNRNDWSLQPNPALPKEGELLDDQKTLKRDCSADTGLGNTPSQKESTGDIDYFEKFTLVDVVVPGEQAPELQEDAEQPQAKPKAEEQKPAKEADRNSPSASEDSFVFVTDVDIAGEHLDEVFYGAGAPDDALQQRGEDEAESGTRRRRPSHRSLMENGSRLFGAEDTVLTPIFLSPGPPKIIDQILLDEPTAMSFMYSDLYEDAVGERRKSDEERSEAESMASEKTYKRRLSDSDEADGYLEKFILKDETSTVQVEPESVEENREGRMMWSQSKFDMTGCLTRVTTEDDEDKSKTEDPETREVSVGDGSDNLQSATLEGRSEIITEAKKELKEIQVSIVTEGESHDSIEASTLREDQMEDQGVKCGGKIKAPESSVDKPLIETQKVDVVEVEKAEERAEHPAEVPPETTSVVQTEQPRDAQVVSNAAGETAAAAPVSSEAPHITDICLSKEAATDTEMMADDEKEASAGEKQMETSAQTSLCEKNEAADVVPGDVLSFEVITECDSAVQALVEVSEKTVDETEIQTEIQIDLREAISVETTDEEEKAGVLAEGAAVEGTSPTLITEGYQETEVEAEILGEVTEPAMLDEVKKDSDKSQISNSESMEHQQEEPVADSELKATEDTGNVTQEKVHMDDELVLLVPKGQAVEMDIEISQLSQKTPSDPEALSEPDRLTAPETPTTRHESPQAPTERTGTRPRLEVTRDKVLKEDTLSIHQVDSGFTPPAAEEEAYADAPKERSDFEEVEGEFLALRSLTPQEDLSGSHSEDRKSGEAEAEQKAEIHNEGDAPETCITRVTQHLSKEIDEHREDVEPKHDQTPAEATEVTADGLEYEIISKQDAEGMPEPDTQRNVEEPLLESGQERDEGMEMEMEEEEEEEKVLDDEFIEADYEIIDAEEESQARLAAELQQMDRFCITCGCLLSEDDCLSGEHQHHEVAAVDQAYEEIKEKLSDWISELQARSENIEDLVSELEMAYNSVEDQCVESEAAMQAQNEETKALVMEQYNDMSVSMEEEKKAKLEQLYDQIVALQESIDTAKATLETTAREAETDARSPEDINARIKATLDSAMSLELGPKGLLVFEDYARGNGSSSHLAQRKGIPVPQRPTLQPQETGLATSTSVTVYWKVNPGDIIDCFQVYCMEDLQGASTAVSEEYRVTVKESYCALEELEPDKTYKVWVMAVNYTGCSLPSERLSFTTAPSVPVIETERCTVMWDSATLRWSSAHKTPEQSYTLEYCRQYELEGEGLRSISGIKSCEQRVLLQPNESYLFYIKAVNECGASEQSEAALISTKGTRFHLLRTSAHPALELSADQTAVHCHAPSTDKQCPSILGELLPAQGRYYWETLVSGSTTYRLGVAYDTADRNSPLGESHLSWCLQCIPTPSGCRFQLLHKDILSSMFVSEVPERVGTLLDHQLGRMSFYNGRSGQLLGTFCQQFTRPCHPALALEMPGSLEVSMVPEVPEFTKDS
ncbi:cardiomyopathy-associated protein 5 [Pungitius pungitius]|uniref:cardiomyopathy-associated protein 5 n=1 Tax=Pungitius pungitius TaxID=134920 RepID=UPI002E10C3A1